MSARPTPLDPSFSNLAAMVKNMGEGFVAQRHDLDELMEDTRAALDYDRSSARMRMAG